MRIFKNFILSFIFCVSILNAKAQNGDFNWDNVINAIIQVESRGDSTAINHNGDCVGIMQIRPILVKDCNRILGREEFTLNDRFSVEKSKQMFRIIQKYYNKKNDIELGIKLWNKGTIVLMDRTKGEQYYQNVLKYLK